MTQDQYSREDRSLEALVSEDQDLLRVLMREALQQVLEAAMS